MLVDTHAHLEAVENLEQSLKHAKEAGVDAIITIGTSVASSQKAIDIAEKYSIGQLKIFATVGIHPYDAQAEIEEKGLEQCIKELRALATTSKKIVGIGEAGLDYYKEADKPSFSANKRPATTDDEKALQKKLFSEQIKIANNLNLPLVVHCRNAWNEIFDELTRADLKKAVLHSFTGSGQDAKAATALGYFVSFSGIVTFKNAVDIQDAAKLLQRDRLLVETDAPYLSPEPFRGQKNESANARITASYLANLLDVAEKDFFEITTENARKAFDLW